MAKGESIYFECMIGQVKIATQLAEVLLEAVSDYSTASDYHMVMNKAHELEHEGDILNRTVFENIATDFITPIDREDIIGLTQRLDDIADYIEDTIRSFYMFDVHTMHPGAKQFSEIIYNSCVALEKAFGGVKDFKKTRDFRPFVVEVNDYEEEGDELYFSLVRHLHIEKRDDPMYVHVWSQIFDRLEKCCDACEHTADYLATVALKNS